MKMESQTLEDGIVKIDLEGRLDIVGTNEVDLKFTAVASAASPGAIVDLSGVAFLASIGIRLLVSSAKAAGNRGGKVVLLQPTPPVRDVLVTAGIDALLPIHEDLDAARADVHAVRRA